MLRQEQKKARTSAEREVQHSHWPARSTNVSAAGTVACCCDEMHTVVVIELMPTLAVQASDQHSLA